MVNHSLEASVEFVNFVMSRGNLKPFYTINWKFSVVPVCPPPPPPPPPLLSGGRRWSVWARSWDQHWVYSSVIFILNYFCVCMYMEVNFLEGNSLHNWIPGLELIVRLEAGSPASSRNLLGIRIRSSCLCWQLFYFRAIYEFLMQSLNSFSSFLCVFRWYWRSQRSYWIP